MKNKLYLILSIIIFICVLSTAAVCNFCKAVGEEISDSDILENIPKASDLGIDYNGDSSDKNGSSDSKSAGKDSSGNNKSGSDGSGSQKDSSPDSSNSSSSSSSSSADSSSSGSSGSSSKSGSKSNGVNGSDKSSNKQNNPPVINNVTFSSNDFQPGTQYTLSCDATDPDNDTLEYLWHVHGGGLNTPEAPSVVWTTPADNGLYLIELTILDGWGGSDHFEKMIPVGGVPLDAPPVIHKIHVYHDGTVYVNDLYDIWCEVSDPNNSIRNFDFSVTGGNLIDQDANLIKWETPSTPATYTLTVTVSDLEGNSVTSSEDFVLVEKRIEITDIKMDGPFIAGDSYGVLAEIIDPDQKVIEYIWSVSGGVVQPRGEKFDEFIDWHTPYEPGTYSITLTIKTSSGETRTRTEDVVLNPR